MSQVDAGEAGQSRQLVDVHEHLAYWTPDRFSKAKPLPFPKLPSPPSGEMDRDRAGRPKGKPATGNARAPDGGWGAQLLRFSTSQVANMNIFPYQTVGKLYMSFGTGHDFVGSAWTIGESSIFTAGHC